MNPLFHTKPFGYGDWRRLADWYEERATQAGGITKRYMEEHKDDLRSDHGVWKRYLYLAERVSALHRVAECIREADHYSRIRVAVNDLYVEAYDYYQLDKPEQYRFAHSQLRSDILYRAAKFIDSRRDPWFD